MLICTCGVALCADHARHGFGRPADATWMRGRELVALCCDCAANEQYDGRLPDSAFVRELFIAWSAMDGCPGITLTPEEART